MWYQSNLKARVGDQERFLSFETKGYRVESRDREEAMIRTVRIDPLQIQAMVAGIKRQIDQDLMTYSSYGVVPNKAQANSKPIRPTKQVNSRSRSLVFSGTSKDPEAYLQWESNMEKWLQSQNIPKDQKLSQAVSAFTRKAHEWWLKESTSTLYKKPVLDWRDLKARMYEEFVEKFQATPRRVTSTSSSANILIPSTPPIIKGENYGVKPKEEVKDDAKVLLVKDTTTTQDKDLRSNPVKGGEDGVILNSLNSRDIEDSIRQTPIGRQGDIRPINQAYQPNQEELSHDSTYSRNLTQKGITEKKNRLNISTHEEDMQLTIRHSSSEPEGDQRLLKEGFRSNQDEPSYKSTWFGNLTHQRYQANWIYSKIHYGLEVIQFLNQEIPDCLYLRSHGFGQLQNQVWRPGEPYNKHSEALESLDQVRTRSLLKRKMQWAFGKAHESDGSEEESKAREAKPPDGLGKESHAYEAKWIYTSPTAQEEDATKAHTFKTAQEKEVTGLWQGPVKSPPKMKPIKRPFHIWCWTCTRKRGFDKAQERPNSCLIS